MLDFGRFVLDSNAAALGQLTEEEAAVYLPFQLAGRDISAYLVDGAFSWSFMAGSELTNVLARGGVVSGGPLCGNCTCAMPASSPHPLHSWAS